jgi:hypothetical protein
VAAWNQSKIKTYRRCQKQFAFRYDTAPGKEMVRKVSSRPLTLGSWMHELQRAHHLRWAGDTKKRSNWEWVHEKLSNRYYAIEMEDREELGDLPNDAERLFRSYLRHWGEVEDQYRVATLHDGSPAVEFVVEVPLTRWGIRESFKGRLDLLVEDVEYGGLWIWDGKWVRRIPDPDERMMSPQALLYAWSLTRLDYDIRGFVYNYGRTKAPTMPPVLKRGTLSVAKKVDTDLATWLQAMKMAHGEKWRTYARTIYRQKIIDLKGRDKLWFRRERIPLEEDRIKRALAEFIVSVRQAQRRPRKNVPRSYFYNCKFSCDYHDICVAQFNGMDIEPYIKRHYQITEERYATDEDLLDA